MNPLLDQLGSTIAWLSVFAPMLGAGSAMALDPLGFSSLLNGFIAGLERFRRELRARWHEPFVPVAPVTAVPWADPWARPAGVILVAISLVGLWETLS